MDPRSALAQLRDGKPAEDAALLDLGQIDLMAAKQAFERRTGAKDIFGDAKPHSTGLAPTEFVAEFSQLCGEDKATQLSYLFMKIDCNSDGQVTWDEFLSYVIQQDTTKSAPLEELPSPSSGPNPSPSPSPNPSPNPNPSPSRTLTLTPTRRSCRRASSSRSCRGTTWRWASCTEMRSRTSSSCPRPSRT